MKALPYFHFKVLSMSGLMCCKSVVKWVFLKTNKNAWIQSSLFNCRFQQKPCKAA